MEISGRKIGKGEPAFIVAEMSSNHNQDYDIAVKTIKAAKEAGANAIKFQIYTPESLARKREDIIETGVRPGFPWSESLYELYQRSYTPWTWLSDLKKIANDCGLIAFASVFDKEAVDFMDWSAYKIASYEIKDFGLIEYVDSKGKPIILSTGMAALKDVRNVLDIIRGEIALLYCVSQYPTEIQRANLRTITDLIERFRGIVGFSDHTTGFIAPVTAVVLGAKIIEKHFILDSSLDTPDNKFSMNPEDFKYMVERIRETELCLGKVKYA